MAVKNITIDMGAFALSSAIAFLEPVWYPAVWIVLILISKTMFAHDRRRACDYLRALVIGAPAGTLVSLMSIEMAFGLHTSIVFGAIVAIVIEQVFKGDWFRQLLDAAIEILRSRLSK